MKKKNSLKFQLADSLNCSPGNKDIFWFVFQGQKILIRQKGDSVLLPFNQDPALLNIELLMYQNLGFFDGHPCYSAAAAPDTVPTEGYTFVNLRSLYGRLPETLFSIAGLGFHTSEWDGASQYCSACGSPLQFKDDERAKGCASCKRIYYPKISPAVIAAVTRDDKILLARSARYRKPHLFSVIAGYVEPGETLEACVAREVREEVNIRVKNIRYFGSQPWPYSGSLMVGFTAEYAGGAIKADGKEITEADWYSREALPMTPGWGSIAGELIEWFKNNSGKADGTI